MNKKIINLINYIINLEKDNYKEISNLEKKLSLIIKDYLKKD